MPKRSLTKDNVWFFLSQKENVIGMNYWVSHGGSTAIFNDDNTPKEAADILQKHYKAVFHQ